MSLSFPEIGARGHRALGRLLIALLAVCFAAVAAPAVDECCVAYAPTNFDPRFGHFPDDQSLRDDLLVLRGQGFTCLATYASDGTLNRIPRIAKEVGFERVWMGIFCPTADAEIDSALAAASWVDGYVIGNEGLGDPREFCPYGTSELTAAMDQVAAASGLPITTSEQVDDYFAGPFAGWLLTHGDLLFPNTHPFWAGFTDPALAVAWTLSKFESLSALTSKTVTFKETGLPTAGCANCSEEAQAEFYDLLAATDVSFLYFEAFDQPWKDFHPVEPHWGINQSSRAPKQIEGCASTTSIGGNEHTETWGKLKARYR